MTVTRYSIAFLALTVLIILLVAGCVQVISRDVLKEVDKRVAFAELIQDPTAYTGRVVLLGGVIVETVNKQEGTLLEVYQARLDSEGRPTQTDRSEGRFLAFYKGYLDAAIYQTGREVTIAGIVEGERVKPLGEMEYRYPSILIKEIHLWKEEDSFQYEPHTHGTIGIPGGGVRGGILGMATTGANRIPAVYFLSIHGFVPAANLVLIVTCQCATPRLLCYSTVIYGLF